MGVSVAAVERAGGVGARLLRPAGFVAGLSLAAYFVREAGLEQVASILGTSGAWLPALVSLELSIVIADGFAARALVDDPSAAPPRTWIRATLLANACSVFLPAGRAAGEALRASTLSSAIGPTRAGSAAVRLQGVALVSNAAASAALAAVIAAVAPGAVALPVLLAANALVCGALGGSVFLLARSRRIAAWLVRLLARFAPQAPTSGGPAAGSAPGRALAFCLTGRVLQTAQYGLAVAAVGGALTLPTAVTAHGIHLVGATAGDLLPSQLGAMEGTYRYLGSQIGFVDSPARAVSIALVMRGVQVALASGGLLVASLLPRQALRK
jgi:hypothetical protein